MEICFISILYRLLGKKANISKLKINGKFLISVKVIKDIRSFCFLMLSEDIFIWNLY